MCIPLAVYTFDDDDLQLSVSALEHLKMIKEMIKVHRIDSSKVQSECKSFFEKYGSHVSKGPLCFGGVYQWTCSSTGFEREELEFVKNFQESAVNCQTNTAFMGLGISDSVDITAIKPSEKCSEALLSQTQLVVNTNGGPQGVNNLTEWSVGMASNKMTWSLIDRGTMLVPVWEIIAMNYGRELNVVITVLRNAWEEFTDLQISSNEQRVLYNPRKVLKEVESWENEEYDKESLEECLRYLLNVKCSTLRESHSFHAWIEHYLSKKSIQVFINSAVNELHKFQSSQYIKFLLQQISEQAHLSKVDFPDKNLQLYGSEEASNVQVECDSFDSFSIYLEHILSDSKNSTNETQVRDHKTSAENLMVALSCLRSNFQKKRQKAEELFIITLVYPYLEDESYSISPTCPVLLKPLSLHNLKYLLMQFEKHRKTFEHHEKGCSVELQAYLFQFAISTYLKRAETQILLHEKQLCGHLLYMKKFIGGELQPEIVNILSIAPIDWLNIQQKLDMLMISNQNIPLPQSNNCPLITILKSTEEFHQRYKSVDLPHNFCSYGNVDSKVKNLFEQLGLDKYYPQKLMLKDALSIRHLHRADVCTEPSQLLNAVLQKLMAFDHRCRSKLLDTFYDISRSSSKLSYNEERMIHPMDSLLAVIHCADDFLRHDLMARLASCQLAVPLILPDPFIHKLSLPLWALKSIVKEWKCMKDNEVIEKEHSIVSYPSPIVTFIRFGKRKRHGISKSKLLNEVISDTHFDHFFHRDCGGGHYMCLLGDGLVETTWYLPGGKVNDVFPDAVTFINLRGDAREHVCQSTLLSQISSMCFIILAEDVDDQIITILKLFSSVPGGFVLLLESDEVPIKIEKALPEVSSISLERKGQDEIKKDIQKHIKNSLNAMKPYKSLEDCIDIIHHNECWNVRQIRIDGDSEDFIRGHNLATLLQNLYYADSKCGEKQTLLPLQGKELWQSWAQKDREQHRQLQRDRKTTVNDYISEIQEQKSKIREDQLRFTDPLTPLMELFIMSLLSLHDQARHYYLQCLKVGLNGVSRNRVSDLLHKYQQARSEFEQFQYYIETSEASNPDIQVLKQYRKNMEELQERLSNVSFDLEHLLRELGQVYEAVLHKEPCNPQFSRLPKIAAEILISGYPLELMDGDAVHVPIKWVTKVLEEVVTILEDPSVFVLSVLGLQSTGKSTLINTTFGLQFRVSAGRCTRGAFMQLIPFSEELREEKKCDYLLVVDTEGLRAPELDAQEAQKHDNELATFVIGLANETLINISGEVPGDIDDILQTSVHAFLRMRKIKLNPGCQFVHQHAGASMKGDLGRMKFVRKLDEMTLLAAKEEMCQGEFKTFSDVIEFNERTDAHHFQGLWKGNPPMAPVNEGYSECAQTLKSHIVELVKDPKICKLSSFLKKLNDLWDALLHEKFIFSFKNTLEITAYYSLEKEYNKWKWELTKEVYEWELKAENEISIAKQNNTVATVVQGKLSELPLIIHIKCNDIRAKMHKFFDESRCSSVMSQWRSGTDLKLQSLAEKLKLKAEDHLRQLGDNVEKFDAVRERATEYNQKITTKVKEMVAAFKKERHDLEESEQLTVIQLRKILDEKLFVGDQIRKYEGQGLITQDQKSILLEEELTAERLHLVLDQGLLKKEQIIAIVEQGRQDEVKLEEHFNAEWKKWLEKLPRTHQNKVNIEHEVERVLTEHVGSSEGRLIKELERLPLAKRDTSLSLKITTDHIMRKPKAWMQMVESLRPTSNVAHIKQAQIITDCVVLEIVKTFFGQLHCVKFTSTLMEELLCSIDENIERKAVASDEFSFTKQYRIDVYLAVCGYAIEQFEKMELAYWSSEKNNPIVWLEKERKELLFTEFKNQYYQLTHEKATANILCKHFITPIERHLGASLGTKVVEDMRRSNQCFKSKLALKAQVLIDLGEGVTQSSCSDIDLSGFFLYITNSKLSLEQWIRHYIKQHCETCGANGQSNLRRLALTEVTSILIFLRQKVINVTKKFKDAHYDLDDEILVPSETWLSAFFQDDEIKGMLGAVQFEEVVFLAQEPTNKILNIISFTDEVISQLKSLEAKLQLRVEKISCNEISSWYNSPQHILQELIGCCEQCPFCKEQCDWDEHGDNIKHYVQQHRPDCLGRFARVSTNKMTLDLCNVMVGTPQLNFRDRNTNRKLVPYQKYQEIYPNWSIPIDFTTGASSYWKWFVGQYAQEIADYFGAKAPIVPQTWKELKWNNVKRELRDRYNL